MENNAKEIEQILKWKNVVVVGLSKDPGKDSHGVALYLQKRGYKIVPVNPTADEILGERCYPSLLEVPTEVAKTIQTVDVFRPSEQVPAIVDQVLQLREKMKDNPKAVWMQLGIESEEAAAKAEKARLLVVQDACIMVEHRQMVMRAALRKS
jgi:predicted CoA-binding protein